MGSPPPTRRSRRAPGNDSSLPIIPILIGVIVLGFVIGAGLSLAGRHDVGALAVASPSPSAALPATLAPVVPVTPAPTERPTAEPTDEPTEAPTREPATFAPAPPTRRPARTAVPSAITPHPSVSDASAANVAAATAAPIPSSAPAASAAPQDAAAATTAADAPPAATADAKTQADSKFAKLSADVVRQYIEAVKRGDEESADAVLGDAKGANLTESGVIDSQTRVGRIDAHTAANDDALVSVQLQTASGPYFGQYTVHKTDTGAAVIVAHSIVKP